MKEMTDLILSAADRVAQAQAHIERANSLFLALDRADADDAKEIAEEIDSEVTGAELEIEYALTQTVERVFDWLDYLEENREALRGTYKLVSRLVAVETLVLAESELRPVLTVVSHLG
jgi:poly-beta-hydroxyalkanoate depolymerase